MARQRATAEKAVKLNDETHDFSRFTGSSNGFRVSVHPEPLEDHSRPRDEIFAFAYTIKIENTGEIAGQLLERHWIIMSSDRQIGEVVGPGVVGVQPRLEPGESFQYSSSAVIHDPVGAMVGSFTFRDDSGRYFEVAVPRFELIYPIMLH